MKYSILFSLLCFTAILQAQNFVGDKAEIDAILEKIDSFSAYYVAGNYEALANSYTEDGKIMPGGTKIISGRAAIQKRWTLPENVTILHHQVMPEEIVIKDDIAYDWGYYQGKTKNSDGDSEWKGKYVIVWKKVSGDWKIYLDIWNRVNE